MGKLDNKVVMRYTGVPMPSALRPTISDEFEIPSEGVDIDFTKGARNHNRIRSRC
jgi:hypothetical protein